MSKKPDYQNASLMAYVGLILGDQATPESRLQAVEMMAVEWKLEDNITSNIKNMVAWLDDEKFDVSDAFSIYFALASICPDYTMSYLEMEIPFLNTNTGQVETRKATVAIIMDPLDTSEEINADDTGESLAHTESETNTITTNKRLH